MELSHIEQDFHTIFPGDAAPRCFFAPGRVNLIGEHTDYNGGHVFPCAITLGIYALARKNDTVNGFRLYSANKPEVGVISCTLDNLEYNAKNAWASYPMGVILTLKNAGFIPAYGLDIYYYGTLPNSSGLSSSACIEVLTAFILKSFFGFDMDMITIAKLAQKSENEYNGVACGIMDQFAIAMGQENKAIFLDTNTLTYQYVPVELGDYQILIMNTNKKRGLADSKYNTRRAECEEALKRLQSRINCATLGALSTKELEKNRWLIHQPVLYRRAHHAVSENERTMLAVEALKAGDLVAFAGYINASGESLRYDYEVTGKELDTLVDAAREQTGVLCARMTGAGFGGCAIALVHKDYAAEAIEAIATIYKQKIGYAADFYIATPGDGPRELKELA